MIAGLRFTSATSKLWLLVFLGTCGCGASGDSQKASDRAKGTIEKPVVSDREGSITVDPTAPAAGPSGSASAGSATAGAAQSTQARWHDMTEAMKVEHVYRNGHEANQFTILESLGGGIALLDFDCDGRLDLFAPGGGKFEPAEGGSSGKTSLPGLPAQLFRATGDGPMQSVATAAGAGFETRCYNHGAFAADYDSDGFTDVLVSGYGGLHLWRNQGDGTFLEVHSEAGLNDEAWSSACAWADFNRDGHLDLYVAHYVDWSFDKHPFCRGRTPDERDICPPREFSGLPDTLYLSNNDGSFRDVSAEWGLKPDGKGLGVLVADFDGNGFVDIYVANDTTNNFYYANQGEPPLRELAMIAGVAADKAGVPNGSMGVDLCDFDQNGRTDIWVTNYEREDFALYRNDGPSAFLHVSDVAGLNVLGGLFVGFGTTCADFNLDGFEDIIVNNGHVILFPTASPRAQSPILMLGEKRRFRRATFPEDSYFRAAHEGRGLAVGDIDADGDLDAVFSNVNAPLAILRNDMTAPGHHWLQVELVGRTSNRDAVGAVVTVTSGKQKWMRNRKGGGSYMSTSQKGLAFGLGEIAQVEELTVQWPSGLVTHHGPQAANQSIRIVEPQAASEESNE